MLLASPVFFPSPWASAGYSGVPGTLTVPWDGAALSAVSVEGEVGKPNFLSSPTPEFPRASHTEGGCEYTDFIEDTGITRGNNDLKKKKYNHKKDNSQCLREKNPQLLTEGPPER